MRSDLAITRWLRASAKLSRAHGVATWVVVHRLSDLTAAGDQGSEQVRLARGLLADVETRVVYGQPPSEVDAARDLLGLSDTEAELLPRLARGVALWKVGTRTFLVEHRLGAAERAIVDTDARMAPQAHEFSVTEGSGAGNPRVQGGAWPGGRLGSAEPESRNGPAR